MVADNAGEKSNMTVAGNSVLAFRAVSFTWSRPNRHEKKRAAAHYHTVSSRQARDESAWFSVPERAPSGIVPLRIPDTNDVTIER